VRYTTVYCDDRALILHLIPTVLKNLCNIRDSGSNEAVERELKEEEDISWKAQTKMRTLV